MSHIMSCHMTSPTQPFYLPFYLPFTTPFYQPVLPMLLVHTGHHTDLHANHGHPCLVLRYRALVTHLQFIWMIRILARSGLSRNNHPPEHTRNMFIQPTTKELITLLSPDTYHSCHPTNATSCATTIVSCTGILVPSQNSTISTSLSVLPPANP